MKNNFKRILAMLLAVMMVVGMCAFPVSATEPTVEQPDPCEEHNWEFQKTVAPSCSKQGYDLWYCDVCYRYEQRNVVGTEDHTWEPKGEVLPTCTTDGHPEGEVCSVCGEFNGTIPDEYKAQPNCGANCTEEDGHAMDPAKDCYHVWGPAEVVGDPCKDEDATITYKCTEKDCDAVNVVKNNDGHQWEWTVNQEPTCQEGTEENEDLGLGSATRYCPICKISQTVVIERLDHDFETSKAGSSETNCGETCTGCGKTQASEDEHEWGEEDPVVVPAECGKKGSKTYTCTNDNCGYVYVEDIAALEHGVSDKEEEGDKAWGKDEKVSEQELVHTKNDADNKDHTITWKCAECEEEWVETVKKVEHMIEDETGFEEARIDPTCTLDGVKFGRCSCGKLVQDILPATGHTKNEEIEPDMSNYNCVTGGYYIYTCVCGEQFNENVDPGAHDYVTKIVDEDGNVVAGPSCGANAWEIKVCKRCEDEKSRTLKEMPHDHNIITYITIGKGCVDDIVVYKYCNCSECDDCEYEFDVSELEGLTTVEAIDAAIADSTSGKIMWKKVTDKIGSHSMSEETVIIPSTCHETGWWGYECANCDLIIKTDPLIELNVNNHDYSDRQYLVNFRWTCSANGGEQLYSEIYCAACHNIYSVKTVVSKVAGINIEVGKYYNFNPETKVYTEIDVTALNDEELKTRGVLKTITLYVEGVVKATPETLEITSTQLAAATTDVVTAGTGHVWFVDDEADCEDEGEKHCVLCTITAKIPTTNGHVEPEDEDKDEKEPATCTKEGTWEGPCQICGETMTGKIEKKAHEPVDDEDYQYPDTDHPASCTSNALYFQICDVCGAKLNTTFEKPNTQLDHFYDQEVTCTYEDCDHSDISECEFIADATKSCIKKATYYKSCACGESSKDKGEGVEATFEAGSFGSCIKEPSTTLSYTAPSNKVCVEYSFTVTEYCAVCDTVYTWDNYVAATNHEKNEGTWVDPTCIMLGYTYYACQHCGEFADENGDYFFEIDIPEIIPEGETNEGEPNKNAPHVNQYGDELTGNCQVIAHGDLMCTVCNKEIPKKHNPGAADACKVTTCTVCGEKDKSNAEHDFVKDEEASKPATKDEPGVLVEVCSRCNEPKNTTLNQLPAVEYSLEVYNPNGSDIVNGGKAYVAVKIKCNDINVSAISVKINVDTNVFNYTNVVKGVNALGGNTSAYDTNGTVMIAAFAGNERENVAMNGEYVLCVLEFKVVYKGGASVNNVENDIKESDISFVVADSNQVLDENNKPAVFDITTNASVTAKINQIGDVAGGPDGQGNDGQITLEDVKAILDAVNQYLANGQQFTEDFKYDSRYDINKDGKYSTADFTYVVRAFIGDLTYEDIVGIQE